MFTCPADLRPGSVSERLSCAVNPFAAHAAVPSEPLPRGSDCAPAEFGLPSTMSDRRTTFGVSTWKLPFCQAVLAVAAAAEATAQLWGRGARP